jgi:hypothetical protein
MRKNIKNKDTAVAKAIQLLEDYEVDLENDKQQLTSGQPAQPPPLVLRPIFLDLKSITEQDYNDSIAYITYASITNYHVEPYRKIDIIKFMHKYFGNHGDPLENPDNITMRELADRHIPALEAMRDRSLHPAFKLDPLTEGQKIMRQEDKKDRAKKHQAPQPVINDKTQPTKKEILDTIKYLDSFALDQDDNSPYRQIDVIKFMDKNFSAPRPIGSLSKYDIRNHYNVILQKKLITK